MQRRGAAVGGWSCEHSSSRAVGLSGLGSLSAACLLMSRTAQGWEWDVTVPSRACCLPLAASLDL